MAVNSTDKFIVNRSNQSYQVEQQNLMANLRDDDLMLVNRDGQSYKATGSEIKDSIDTSSPPVIGTVTLAEDSPGGDRFTDSDFTSTVAMTAPGDPVATLGIKTTLEAKLVDKLQTSAITNVGTLSGDWTSAVSAPDDTNYYGVIYGGDKFVAVGANRAMYSADGISWTEASGVQANRWRAVAYGGGKFVATAIDGTNRFMYSNDGITWTSSPKIDDANSWAGVTYGGDKFVAVAGDGSYQVQWSYDGSLWQRVNAAEANSWNSVTYGNGKFVAVAYSGTNRVMYSTDGISWSRAKAAEANNWRSVTYGNGKFVAVATTAGLVANLVMYSTDGISWSPASATEDNTWYEVTYGSGKFVAVAASGTNRVMYSTDGISWTGATAAEANDWNSVTFGDGKFVAVASSGTYRVMWSYTGGDDGTQLTFTDNKDLALLESGDAVDQSNGAAEGVVAATNPAANTMNLAASTGTWSNGQTVVGPVRPLITSEITNVADKNSGPWQLESIWGPNYQAVAYGADRFIVVSLDERQLQSLDGGNTWTERNASNNGDMVDLIYADGIFVACCTAGKYPITWSGNGNSWTTGSNGAEQKAYYKLAYGDGRFVCVGTNCCVYSDDGKQWNAVSVPNGSYRSLAYGDGKFIAYTSSGTAGMYSTDGGETWTDIGGPGAPDVRDICYGNGMFIAVGSDPGAFYSYDGINWTAANAIIGNWHRVIYADGMFVASGKGEIMTSFDGLNWIDVPDSVLGTTDYIGLTHGDGMFVACGNRYVIHSPSAGLQLKELTFADDSNLSLFEGGDPIKQDDDAASGSVATVDVAAKTMQVGGTSGTWSANTGNFVIGPPTPSLADATLYGKLDSSLNVLDLQSADPGYTAFSGTQPKVKFPAILPDGQTPDATLLAGTQIKTTAQADNLSFPAVTKDSNTITPGVIRSGGFDSNDPAQVAAFEVVQESLETYEQERDTRRATLAQAMRDASISEDEIKSVGLD